MMQTKLTTTAVLLVMSVSISPHKASAQHDHTQHSKYAEFGDRQIKALSDEDVSSLLEGQGMGFALPAELNGYPGPRHVIELADDLALTDEQAAASQRIFKEMNEKAVELGRRIVEMEGHLDGAFADGSMTVARLKEMTAHIAKVQGELRAVHLAAHLEMYAAVTEAQRKQYDVLRGYARP